MKHIPNLLSSFRLALIPFFVWQMAVGQPVAAGIILIVSGLTDLLDGKLARRFGWITDLGKVLDPLADKLTQAAVSITLAVVLRRYWYFFAVLVLKDLVMLILGGALIKKGAHIDGARWFGKVSTCVYYAAAILIVLVPGMPHRAAFALLSLAVLCALAAALMYIPEFIRYRRNIGRSDDSGSHPCSPVNGNASA